MYSFAYKRLRGKTITMVTGAVSLISIHKLSLTQADIQVQLFAVVNEPHRKLSPKLTFTLLKVVNVTKFYSSSMMWPFSVFETGVSDTSRVCVKFSAQLCAARSNRSAKFKISRTYSYRRLSCNLLIIL